MKTTLPYILIVDDNLANLHVTTSLLKTEGYRIGLAQDGPSALKQLESRTPDLILLDIMMPGIDGLEVCKTIKEQPHLAEIPVIFLTAKDSMDDLVEAFKVGGIDYITKPFQKDELLARVKTHIDLYWSRRRIEEMNMTRDKLYSIIAHDIKTPFSNIMLMIDALKNKHIDPSSKAFTDIVNRLAENTNSTYSLLKNLLTWTRFQTHSNDLSPQLNSISALVYETVHLLGESALKKSIQIKTEFQEPCLGYFDETTMHTVIRNLISNAIKFTPEHGHIHISLITKDDYQWLIIKDTGVGMSQEIIQTIFEYHKTVTTPGTAGEPGTGLGLMMIKDFVARNKGKVQVKSQVDRGTEISVLIPVKAF